MKSNISSLRAFGGAVSTILAMFLAGLPQLAHCQTPAPQPSLSELLEKGLYSEETKGDLDSAIQIYQQVLSGAKAGQALAAQAQFRLGMCYYKKKQHAEASAAFEKLVKDYPDQKDLVARAHDYLGGDLGLQPTPWADGEAMQLDIKFPSGFKIGMMNYSVFADDLNGRRIWRLASHGVAGMATFSRVEVDADSFKPIHSRWKHPLIGDVDAVYADGRAELKTAGKNEIKKVDLEGMVFDNEEAIQLMRRLPLAVGYKTSVRIITTLGGGTIIPLEIVVTNVESIVVAAGAFDCYKAELSNKQTFWYETNAPHLLVKFEAGGAIAELTSVSHRQPGEPSKYLDPAFNFSMTAPADWFFFRGESKNAKESAHVTILDPEAVATSEVTVRSMESLKLEAKKSARDCAEQEISEYVKELKDFRMRDESWSQRTVDGRSGVSFIGDYSDKSGNQTLYSVNAFGVTNAAKFVLTIDAKGFDGFKPKFDAVVDSYRAH